MKSIFKYLFFVSLFFFHIYVIKFAFSPISTRVLFGFFGAILIIKYLLKSNRLKISKITFKYLISLIVIGLISFFTNSIHSTSEFHYIIYIFQSIIIICSSYFCIFCVSHLSKKEISFEYLSRIFIGAVALQMIITVIMFLSPSVKEHLISIQSTDSFTEVFLEGGWWRVTGFGSEYFIAGVVNCYALLLISHCILYDRFNINILLLCFILISIIGSVMSRTTLVGIVLGITYILTKGNSKIRILIFKYIAFIIIAILIIGSSTKIAMTDQMETTLRFGFEAFYNYFETGTFTTASAENLLNDHYSISKIPQGITLIIGDGFYADPSDSDKYYMNIDAGYLRLIYYFGILGLVAFLVAQYHLLTMSKINEKSHLILKWYLILLIIILNIKGVTDLTPFIALFVFTDNKN